VGLFQNLIGNAVKYRRPEQAPKIEISLAETSQDWVIGIAPADYDRAFGIFQRLVARDQYEGTGIGLAVCKKIVEHHGGRIWIDSRLGEGSTFPIALPHPLL
jgi:light-regulated signal transduction histidine kinase (bacteriophytochrome)